MLVHRVQLLLVVDVGQQLLAVLLDDLQQDQRCIQAAPVGSGAGPSLPGRCAPYVAVLYHAGRNLSTLGKTTGFAAHGPGLS